MHAHFKPFSPAIRNKSSDRSNFSFTANKKQSLDSSKRVTLWSTPQEPSEQMEFADLVGREVQKAEEVQHLQAALDRKRSELELLRRTIHERKIEDELRKQIQCLQLDNQELEKALEDTAHLADNYKKAAHSACKQIQILREENLQYSQLTSKLRFLLSYLIEKMQALFEKFEIEAVKLEGRVDRAVLQETMGGFWSELRKMMVREQHSICHYVRNSAGELTQELSTGDRVMSKLLVRELV